MAEDLSKSLIVRSIRKGGSMMALVGPWLPIPYVAAIGQVMEKLPIEEGVEWAQKAMAHYGKQSTAPSQAGYAEEPALVAPVAETAEPVMVEAKHAPSVAKEIAEAVASEPFEIALQQAVEALPTTLSNFMLDASDITSGVGVWPAFVLETVARWHFRSELGRSVAASNPVVATLIESGLAREAIELLRQGIDAKGKEKPPGVALRGRGIFKFLIWRQNPDYKWPGLGTFSPGYFVASRSLDGRGTWQDGQAEKDRMILLGALGRMSQSELDRLTAAWRQTCEAVLSNGRDAEISKGLPQLKL